MVTDRSGVFSPVWLFVFWYLGYERGYLFIFVSGLFVDIGVSSSPGWPQMPYIWLKMTLNF